MNEDQNNATSSSSDEKEDNIMQTYLQGFTNFFGTIFTEKNEETTTSGVVFQEVLCKIQQVRNNDEVDSRNRIRQGISLYSELVDTVEKATYVDASDAQNCLELLHQILLAFESRASEKDEQSFVREIFFALLDLLSKPQIRSYLNNDQHIEQLHMLCYKFLTDRFLVSATNTVAFVSFTRDHIAIQKYTDTFCVMYKRAKDDLQSGLLAEEPTADDMETADWILSFFWNLAYSTIIVPWLLGIGLIKSMLECLKIAKLSSQTAHKIIAIIHNISRHDDGADELRKFDGLSIIKGFQTIRMNDFNDQINLILSMTIALLSTPEQIRLDNKRMNKILNQLLQITIDADKTKNYRSKYGSQLFHVSAPLAVFTKLFVDDHSLEYVLSHAETEPQTTVSSTIALFANLLIDFRGAFADENQLEQFTCTALLNILWSISFQDRYKTKLQQNKDFLKTIKSLAMDNGEAVVDQYIPRSMESMAKAANGILYNLNEILDSKQAAFADAQFICNASNEKPMIMISYAHDNNLFCDKILAEFEKNQNLFGIWIDRDHCSSSEDLWEKIARGIRQSSLVICLLSQDYYKSKSCRKEATLAVQRKKAIIPVYIDDPGDCDWLDIHIAGLKYIRFKDNNTELDRGKVQELLKTIQATINETQTQPQQQKRTKQHTIPTQPQKEIETIKSITFDMKKSPEEWTVDDIHRWFDSHKVPDTLVKLFDFQSIAEMHEYAEKLRTDPKKEFIKYEQRYANNYGGEELEEYKFNRFKAALLSLSNNQHETMKKSLPSGQASTPKSSACTIL